mmetsp:Transcript_9137/g.22403  ORF Transcript_9137/g.22403 Transcript_9137/m.22403 type:complete len:320 (+) Transcript_9137:246-1205(+)
MPGVVAPLLRDHLAQFQFEHGAHPHQPDGAYRQEPGAAGAGAISSRSRRGIKVDPSLFHRPINGIGPFCLLKKMATVFAAHGEDTGEDDEPPDPGADDESAGEIPDAPSSTLEEKQVGELPEPAAGESEEDAKAHMADALDAMTPTEDELPQPDDPAELALAAVSDGDGNEGPDELNDNTNAAEAAFEDFTSGRMVSKERVQTSALQLEEVESGQRRTAFASTPAQQKRRSPSPRTAFASELLGTPQPGDVTRNAILDGMAKMDSQQSLSDIGIQSDHQENEAAQELADSGLAELLEDEEAKTTVQKLRENHGEWPQAG